MGNNKNNNSEQPDQLESKGESNDLDAKKQDVINKIIEVLKTNPSEKLQKFMESWAKKDKKEIQEMLDKSEEDSKKRKEKYKLRSKDRFSLMWGDCEEYLEELDEIELVVKQFTKKSYSDIADWINKEKEHIKMGSFYESLSKSNEKLDIDSDWWGLDFRIRDDTTLQRKIIEVSSGYAKYIKDNLEKDKKEIQEMLDFIENCNKNRKK